MLTVPPPSLRRLPLGIAAVLACLLLVPLALAAQTEEPTGGGDTGTVILPLAAAPGEEPRQTDTFDAIGDLELVPTAPMANAVANMVVDGVWYGPVATANPDITLTASFLQALRDAGVDIFDLWIIAPSGLYQLVVVTFTGATSLRVDCY